MNQASYKFILTLLLSISLYTQGCNSLENTRETSNTKESIMVIAHRGASAYAPENTLSAFEKAVELKAPWYELDCQITKDGKIIVLHDKDLERTTGKQGIIWETHSDDLKGLETGAWFSSAFKGEPLPTLTQSLEMAKGRIGVYVEIKSCDSWEPIVGPLLPLFAAEGSLTPKVRQACEAALEQHSNNRDIALTRGAIHEIRTLNMEKEIVIQSFSPLICLIALLEAPDLRTEFLGSDDPEKPEQWERFVNFGMQIGVHGFNVSHGSLTPERLQWFHDQGKTVAVWTVDEPVEMKKFADWGVDGIITNKPDVVLDVLGR